MIRFKEGDIRFENGQQKGLYLIPHGYNRALIGSISENCLLWPIDKYEWSLITCQNNISYAWEIYWQDKLKPLEKDGAKIFYLSTKTHTVKLVT